MKFKPFVFGAALILAVASTVAQAATYSFYQLTNNTTNIGSQLNMSVEQSGSNILFTFTNMVGTPSSITAIYFDEGSSLFSSIGIKAQSSGVSFSDGANPSNLPGSSGIGFTADYAASANNKGGTVANGVNNASEWITFAGTLTSSESFNDILNALSAGGLQIGLHVQSVNGGLSDSYVNNPSPVPLPAAAWLFGSALLGFTMVSSRKRV